MPFSLAVFRCLPWGELKADAAFLAFGLDQYVIH
jgi:hypothetical protein